MSQKKGGFLLPDDLEDVHLAPVVRLGHRLVASLAQLDANGVRLHGLDRRANVFNALGGQMSGADEVYVLVSDLHVRDTLRQGDIIGCFHASPLNGARFLPYRPWIIRDLTQIARSFAFVGRASSLAQSCEDARPTNSGQKKA